MCVVQTILAEVSCQPGRTNAVETISTSWCTHAAEWAQVWFTRVTASSSRKISADDLSDACSDTGEKRVVRTTRECLKTEGTVVFNIPTTNTQQYSTYPQHISFCLALTVALS